MSQIVVTVLFINLKLSEVCTYWVYKTDSNKSMGQKLFVEYNISPSLPPPSVCQDCVWKQTKKTYSMGLFVLPSCLVKTYFAAVFVSHLSNWLSELLFVQENEKFWWLWVYFYCLFLPREVSLRQAYLKVYTLKEKPPLAEVSWAKEASISPSALFLLWEADNSGYKLYINPWGTLKFSSHLRLTLVCSGLFCSLWLVQWRQPTVSALLSSDSQMQWAITPLYVWHLFLGYICSHPIMTNTQF